ncbi:DUF2330 domain-containing protein [Polyangium jinanense]|uniref:DUF2330 domain-containing protein n=1 Tax=Polyangium jinanense TaxID=2829994 RepID=A0A9X3X5Q1_9BACT|nr:DUF2330 domain-containing protein [Polyangium jinanense]MDC3961275.1 DUF2330 domain-containing protein [Polyangium jinanense]MDC3984092.1 DUF2330 domain-containing protein [Polyangium jinanense]
MKLFRALVLSLPLLAAPVLRAGDAEACGGCIISQSESTQVSSHRMILSISQQQTTLWDQITYAGEPSSFAWVLPIKGEVEVGLSSDALFGMLDQWTRVEILSPTITCTLPPGCFGGFDGGVGFASSSSTGGGGVVVIAEEVVGPYATVQLKSQDPNALTNWLTMNGYNIPPDIAPIINAYVQEGFDFLALKLVPGQGVNAMRPVRVTGPGASLSLPLRMVAAGTGATTPISLWVMGEGRYEPKNFPRFEIGVSDLVWNWDTESSNYKELRQNNFDASGGKAWLIETAAPFSKYFAEGLLNTAQNDPANSGYGDDPAGPTALEECQADLDKLYGTIDDQNLWVTRMYAELSRPALAADLVVGAAAEQVNVERYLQVSKTAGTPPPCPPPPPGCEGAGGAGGAAGAGGNGSGNGNGNGDSGGGCAVSGASSLPGALALLGGAALVSAVRRRRRP